ncbi:MAG: transposase [Ignavibacteria bacterium]
MEYNNLYTHFIFITLNRLPLIHEVYRIRIDKYITGIINYNDSKLYSIYANPDHFHFIVSRSPKLSMEYLSTIISESSERFMHRQI